MRESRLADYVTGKDQKFILVYDFLRMWCFLIELVETLPESYENPTLELSVGDAPDEMSKEIDFDSDMSSMDLGNEIDDIFSDSSEDDDEFEGFENIDDMDI